MQLHLRPAASSDASFLARVHDATRDELSAVGLPPHVIIAVLRQQHESQERAYEARFDRFARFVIVADGHEVGRLYLDEDTDGVRIVDVAVLPEHRDRGIGTAVLRRVIDLAGERPVHLTVRRDSRAVAFYRRIGFVEVGGTATDLAMTAVAGRAEPDRTGDVAARGPRQPKDAT